MNNYNAIAGVYDKINSGVDYVKWADFLLSRFNRYMDEKPEIILDLACGTGKMTLELAKRNYDLIGIDGSENMLSKASEAVFESILDGELSESGKRPLFLCQDIREFELYGTVQAVVCCLDSLNYLTKKSDLEKCFRLVHNYLEPGKLFFFDMNTPYKFEKIYGENAYTYDLFESDDDSSLEKRSFCIWQNFYDEGTKICDFLLTVFTEESDGRYVRADEEQKERCYSLDEIKGILSKTGFELLEICEDFSGAVPKDDSDRWYFCARRI